MLKKLSYEDIVFKFNIEEIKIKSLDSQIFIQYKEIYEKFKSGININYKDYNLVLIDKCTDAAVDNLKEFIKKNHKLKEIHDVVYVNYEKNCPRKVLILKAGMGNKLKKILEHIKNKYATQLLQFSNYNKDDEKEVLLNSYLEKKKAILESLENKCKDKGFIINYAQEGFTFIPVKENEKITEDQFETLSLEEKEMILENLSYIKRESKEALLMLKDNEAIYEESLKNIFKEFLLVNIKEVKEGYLKELICDKEGKKFFLSVCNDIEKILLEGSFLESSSYEEKLLKIVTRNNIEVLVQNNTNEVPIIYEKNPTYKNLFGNVEYSIIKEGEETFNVNIEVGSVLKARDGFLIIDIKELLKNNYSYESLKKVLRLGEFSFQREESILSLLNPEKVKTDIIPMNLKVILIGEYKYYNLLYNYDEDFKNLFKIVMESNSILKFTNETKEALLQNMLYICKKYKCKPLTNDAITEVARIFAREGEYKNKIHFDTEKLKDIMIICTAMAVEKGKKSIDVEDIKNLNEEVKLVQRSVEEQFKENEVLFNLQGTKIGEINGLSVIDLGHTKFGRPIRITCTCAKGKGNIIDVQKECNLSGKIHNKSISILKGFLNTFLGSYNEIPVDFNISFEQVYGVIEGDSASVAEAVCIISSLLKLPIRQNIAVTGSINQIGEVQPIGGVNEKIEGFYNICKTKDSIDNSAVLIPNSNFNNIVLNEEVEKAILEEKFHIYTMENIYDALDVLIENNNLRNTNILDDIQRELRKYSSRKERK